MKRSAHGPILAALPCLGALAVNAVLFTVMYRRLPDRMATHFTLTGQADGFSGRVAFLATSAALLAVVAGTMAVLQARAATRSVRLLVAGYGTAGLMGSLFVSVQLVNHGGYDDVSAVRLPPWHLAIALLVGVACAGAGRLAARVLPSPLDPPPPPGEHPRLGLADGELAAWAHATGSWPLGALGLVLTAAALALLPFTALPAACALLAGGLLCLCFARLYVTVGRQGLTVTPGRLPWPRIRVPLEAMTDASHRDIDALGDFGGWGYRIRPGASGVILRSGPTLVVRRAGGREFAVTVDDAATAAALLNSLIARRKAH
ncbi:DUF1648 domain-containing protein [Streptomyces sp. NPDC050263]|uniref:DUF1648 domain-containing protein n=1 Tax=Streptomyces sp. NPDC050263 TaxID=3155037 RepID=UPI003417705E